MSTTLENFKMFFHTKTIKHYCKTVSHEEEEEGRKSKSFFSCIGYSSEITHQQQIQYIHISDHISVRCSKRASHRHQAGQEVWRCGSNLLLTLLWFILNSRHTEPASRSNAISCGLHCWDHYLFVFIQDSDSKPIFSQCKTYLMIRKERSF